ncbi:MAG: 3'(2'),5'-bisphosphate nucleotidase CysQ [Sulfuricurvum sp.]|uniref:3'(2'),5'-bisphosphate nucleotidase CysQ n=1 Tax=Sulfuricurvum sp. TaxID=2025608 RepID=UPI0025D60914|nr:3'(2'),5'-bisphosphate nucleotidase CysQ [Sulfuricurvum sp.]MBV5320312.1 3'(2'),5'-bisphosphate nucleotidase CysQ [Sulfuricurvum sp.]
MVDLIDIRDIITIAEQAGQAIIEIYQQEFEVIYKDDNSPLTKADKVANDIITDGLNALSVKLPILSEEGKEIPFEERKEWEYFWMVDPLDGTKEFIKKNGEFTVNIALIHIDTPVLGVVYAPALDDMYWAVQGKGAFKDGKKLPLYINEHPEKLLRVVASKSHLNPETEEYIHQLAKTTERIECVSRGSSLKFCMIAEGSADIYPRLAPTMEWDTAAADTIVREAGKAVFGYKNKQKITYNTPDLMNDWFIVN